VARRHLAQRLTESQEHGRVLEHRARCHGVAKRLCGIMAHAHADEYDAEGAFIAIAQPRIEGN
jgi:hypothetical protein